jgi:hypothetical protein
MNKDNKNQNSKTTEEYDFSQGVRGKYVDRYRKGTNLVILDAEVAEVFTDSDSVNETLRPLAEIIRRQSEKSNRPSN